MPKLLESSNEQTLQSSSDDKQSNKLLQIRQKKPDKTRIRERLISEVVQVVALWRRLYSGVLREDIDVGYTVLVRYSLDDAANKVGIPKKTLDDYLHLLIMGRKFDFPFTAHGNEKVGKLR